MRAHRASSAGKGRKEWLDVASLVLLVSVVLGSVMAIGAVHPQVLAGVFLLSSVGAVALVIHRGLGREAALAGILLGLAAYSGLQAVSLSARSAALLDAGNAAVFEDALRPWRMAGPLRHSLSLDAHATWLEVGRFVSYAAIVVIAAHTIRAWSWLVAPGVVFASAVLLAMVTLGHGILELRSVFGVYEPRYATPRWVSPLLNPNNLAGYLNLGLLCGGALLSSSKSVPFRLPIGLGMAIVLCVSLLTGSRGGALSLLVGCAALTFSYRRSLFRRGSAKLWLLVGGVGVAAGTLMVIAAPSEAWRAYASTSTKLALFGWVCSMITAHPWFGVGRGAFETAFPPYRGSSLAGATNNVTFAHAENFLLQWAAEWGLPVTITALVAIGYAFWRWGRRPRAAAFVLTALLVPLGQNMVDVALEVPGVCIALLTVASVYFRAGAEEGFGGLRRTRTAVACSALTLFAALPCAWGLARLDTPTEARDRLRDLYSHTDFKQQAGTQHFDEELRSAVLQRPGEPYFSLLGALAARRSGGEPNRWLSRALERDPNRAETYFVLGRVLAERGHVWQGLDMLKYALQRQPPLKKKVARAAIKISHDPALLVRVAPEGVLGCDTLVEIADHLELSDHQRFLQAALAHSPDCRELAGANATSLLAALEDAKHGHCEDHQQCVDAASQAVDTAERAGLPAQRTRLLRARVIAAKTGPKEALAFLTPKCPPAPEDLECARLLLRLYAKGGSAEDLSKQAKEYTAAACDDDEACVKAEQLVGDLWLERKDWTQALLHHERAARQSGTAAAWRRYSQVARQAGSLRNANEAMQHAERYDGHGPDSTPPPNGADDDDP